MMLEFWMLVLAFYIWHGLGVTIGLHRLLSHRAFKCPKFVEYFFVLPAYLAFQGSPIWWATIHRAHHKHSDTPLDPHSPRAGLLHAWVFYRSGLCAKYAYPSHINPVIQSPDLMKDPIYRWLEQYESGNWYAHYLINIAICVLFRVMLYYCFGWTVALASTVAVVMAFNAPLLFNIFSHLPKIGYRNFATSDDSNNCWWLAILSMGDGWHNNHHAYPGSARTGLRPHEIDLSWQLLKLLRALHLASDLNEPYRLPSFKKPAGSLVELSSAVDVHGFELALETPASV
jgi:sn-1 stearoyl-lipid 9-desaturase